MTKPILVTGATGYVGGRLIPELCERGFKVRAMGRSLEKLRSRPWAASDSVELAEGDVFDRDSLAKAAEGCGAAYYLVHSMLPGQQDFEKADRTAALNMVSAVEEAGLERILYLGGLGEDQPCLSKHLKSRAEVARIIMNGKVPVTILRAAMIIGSGSASFEILRYLVDRLPVMITPRWLETPNQPIAVRNVITYLVECLNTPETIGKTFDIGGSEVITYRKLMETYAEEAKLPKRLVIPVPVLTPRLSSYWIHLVTPVPASIARPLAEGLRNPVVCKEHQIRDLIPQDVLSPREAIKRALKGLAGDLVTSHWTDAGVMPPMESAYDGDPKWSGGTALKDERSLVARAGPADVWKVIASIGGQKGWYYANWLWVLRGFLDKCFGGVGLRRGRRNAAQLQPGDALDFWRVLKVKPESGLLLAAEMKLPGRATLEFGLQSANGKTIVSQKALFKPKGLWGIAYWYLMAPFHYFIFGGLLNQIVKRSENGGRKVPMIRNSGLKLVFSIFICQAVGIAGALWTAPNIETWYAGLTKPFFTPPSWVFGPVWTLLYLMMAVSLWLIWRKGLHIPEVRKAVSLFCLQLVVNGLWSFLFFKLRSPLAGLINICLLWGLIGLTIILFYRINKFAGMLLVPYGIWVGFATVLNFSLWLLNR